MCLASVAPSVTQAVVAGIARATGCTGVAGGRALPAARDARRGRAAERRRRPDRERARRGRALPARTRSWWTSAPPPPSTASPPMDASSAASSCRVSAPRPTSSPGAPPSCRPPSSSAPERVIGRRTEECIQAGVLYGTADAVDGIVRRIRAEWPGRRRPRVVATGGLAGRGRAAHRRRSRRPIPTSRSRGSGSRPGISASSW